MHETKASLSHILKNKDRLKMGYLTEHMHSMLIDADVVPKK